MKNLTTEEIIEAIHKIDHIYAFDVLTAIVQHLYQENEKVSLEDVENLIFNIDCINPFGKQYSKKTYSKKPTLEEVKKTINEIDTGHLREVFRAIWKRLIKEGKVPCAICEEINKEDW